jgi:hypothetical protein
MRGNSRFLREHRGAGCASTQSIEIRLKKPKLPKYEGKRRLCARAISRSAAERVSRSSFCFTGVKALLILENQMVVRHVHILFTRAFLSSPAAGLRLEIAHTIDKKKSELYFYFLVKKFLTKKTIRRLPAHKIFDVRYLPSHRNAAPFSLLGCAGNIVFAL